ncbi:ComEC/Rec2 family competence protein [Fodinicurvata halophila]|uniref:ComEC/Rec2 family competence protein n=1 Tax=Fodinicurvata halophila TaxID=1419723 RepID=UPI003641DBEF
MGYAGRPVGTAGHSLNLAEQLLPLMGAGVDLVLDVAHYISSLPQARLLVPQMPLWGLLLCVGGGLWLCLWGQSWRFVGLPVFAIGLGTPVMADPPDILVSEGFEVIAVADPQGQLALSDLRKARFSSGQWLERRAQDVPLRWPDTGTQKETGSPATISAACIAKPGQRSRLHTRFRLWLKIACPRIS